MLRIMEHRSSKDKRFVPTYKREHHKNAIPYKREKYTANDYRREQ